MTMGTLREYLDIGIGANLSGRVVFELFHDAGDSVVENFRTLCQGKAQGLVRGRRTKLSYRGSKVYSIVSGSHLECGDYEDNNGQGGFSIYGGYFKERMNSRRHSHAGLLSMKRMGDEGFGSQFIITLGRAPQLDNKNLVFGRVVEGMEIIRAIEYVPVDSGKYPKVEVGVLNCGLLLYTPKAKDSMSHQRNIVSNLMETLEKQEEEDDADGNVVEIRCLYTGKIIKRRSPKEGSAASIGKQYLKDALSGVKVNLIPEYDQDSQYQLYIEEEKMGMTYSHERAAKAPEPSDGHTGVPSEASDREEYQDEDHEEEEDHEEDEDDDSDSDPVMAKLRMLSNQLEECSNRNQEEVAVELELGNDPKRLNEHYKSTLGLREYNSEVNFNRNPMLNKAAIAVEKQHEQGLKKEKAKSFGWNVFNQETLYRAHKKRIRETSFNRAEYELQKAEMGSSFYQPSLSTHNPTESAKLGVVLNLEKQYKKREKFSRRRAFEDEAQDVSYINQRNRVFNQKLDRAFKSHSAEIKQNLERGTAL